MKLCVLALDYDNTIACDGVLDADVWVALQEARRNGIKVLIVTGRILADLRRVAGDLGWADAVVAENGAVLAFLATGRTVQLGQPPQPELLAALRQHSLDVTAGACVIEGDAAIAPRVLDLIQKLELPLALAFNRGRLMVLPQGISKASGLREALHTLRLSSHNALAIGDAENDHELLAACEVGAAVEWGSAPLRAAADVVICGSGPMAVAPFIRQATAQGRLPRARPERHRLLLGHEGAHRPVTLAVWGCNVLIAGGSCSGKSLLAGALAEQLILQRYAVCVIDPEGDHTALEALPDVLVWRAHPNDEMLHDPVHLLRYPDSSLVVDLSALSPGERTTYGTILLRRLAEHRRRTGLPHRIVVDEAHYFLHTATRPDLLIDRTGYTLVTYQLAALHPDVRMSSEAIIATREDDPQEIRLLKELCGSDIDDVAWEGLLRDLAVDEAVLLPGAVEAGQVSRRFHIAPRLTSHVRHRHKYVDTPVPAGRGFVFTRRGEPIGPPARTLAAFVASLNRAADDVVAEHVRRGDFSRWIADVFGDARLAAWIRDLEQRGAATGGTRVTPALEAAVRERYCIS